MSAAQRFWRLLSTRQRRTFCALQGLSVVMALSTLVGIAAVIPFFSVLGDREESLRHSSLAQLYQFGGFTSVDTFVTALGIAFIALLVLANAVNMLGTALLNRFAFDVGDAFRVEIFRHYLSRGHSFHAARNSASLLNTLLYEVDRVTGLLQSLFSLTSNSIMVAFIVVTAALIDPSVTALAAALLGGCYVLVYALVRRRLTRGGTLQSRSATERAIIATEALAAIKELTIWGAQQQFIDRFGEACHTVTRATSNTQNVGQQPRYILECLAVAGLVAAALVLQANESRVGGWLSQLTFLGLAAYRLLPALQQIFQSAVRMRANLSAFERVEADLAKARSAEHETAACDLPFSQSISLTTASFSYESGRLPAVRNISLEIGRGSMLGIVGANGSGKTTLVDLLLGLLHPDSGTLAIDGQAVTRERYASWQSQLAYVPQHIVLLDGSIAENIAFTRGAGAIDRQRIVSAAHAAGLDELIASLPSGLEERIGERGARLSGGERQRLGIARALYRDSPVLVLDEATSALDIRGEAQVVRALQQLKGRKTIIVVAHRLVSVRACDVIIEIERGEIVGRGTYDELRRTSALLRQAIAANGALND
jgi:HlyD family secretion protein